MSPTAQSPSVSKGEAVPSALPCWCGSDSWQELFRTSSFGLLRCRNCGTYRNDPPPVIESGDSEQFYTNYYQGVGADARRTKDIRIQASQYWRAAQKVPELQKVGESVADVGCGDGHLCARLKHWGWRDVVGFEISKTRAARAQSLYPEVNIVHGLPDPSNLTPGSLDLAIMEAVIEHIPDPVGALSGLTKFLKPDGLIALTTPNLASGHFRVLGKRWTNMLCPHDHVYMFTAESISALLNRAGYKVVAVGSFHEPAYGATQYVKRFLSGDVKGTLWRLHQEAGAFYGRMVDQGPMLYAVGTPAQ
jgi:SAM-dependent methyltransferase